MSHKATNWLANIPPALISASEFRVLFHLCDCHNASGGCFPSQAYLMTMSGLSNGTVNNALNALETKGVIQRRRSHDRKTKRRRPTHYILGFEFDEPQEPSPKTGDGNPPGSGPTHLQPDGDGAISNLGPDPSPKSGPTHLQPTGEEPVKNLEITSARAGARRSINPMVIAEAERAVASWRDGRTDVFDDLQPWVLGHVLAAGLLTEAERQNLGVGPGSEKGEAA